MRFSLFAHMERHDAKVSHNDLYREFIALCEYADANDFCAIWVGEHHGMDFTITPNPFVQIADLARRTQHARLGTATVVAPFWHPLKLAGEAAMTDIITGGRLDISLSRGAYQYEYERLSPGLDAWNAGAKLREMLPALKAIWRGDYAHQGEHWQFPRTTSAPKPLQQPHPPLWIAARDPNSHDFAVANACNVQVTPLWLGDEEVEDLMNKFNAAVANHPEVPRPKIMLLRHTFVAESESELQNAAEHLSVFYCTFGAWFKNTREVIDGRIKPLSADERAQLEMYSPQNMRANQIVGTPREVIKRIEKCAALGYDEYALWLDNGMPHAAKMKTLKLFAEKVMPAFR